MTEQKQIAPRMSRRVGPSRNLRNLVAAMALAAAAVLAPRAACADDTVTLSLTLKDRKFDPVEVHAPAGKPLQFRVKNLNDIVSEFESSDLHIEKIIPAGSEIVVYARPQKPGKYNFFDDFHHETQGVLIVP
jgi:heme/copper-type cytochrome/quinol oxidase subunit 2